MGGLYIGASGMQSHQTALNTTAHNLSNADTVGYVRQQVLFQDNSYVKIGGNGKTTNVGLGTNIASVRHMRDAFADKAYRTEIGRQTFYEEQYRTVSQVESYFGQAAGTTFQNDMQGFLGSLNQLKQDPDSLTNKGNVVNKASSLLDRANDIYSKIVNYQQSLNGQVVDKVDKINYLGQTIHQLNKEIARIEGHGMGNQVAKDLRDERDVALDELSKIIDIEYSEYNSVITVQAENVSFVTEDGFNSMGVEYTSPNSQMLKPVWTGMNNKDVFRLDNPPSMEKGTDVGSLKGILMSRGEFTADYTDMGIPNYDKEVGQFPLTKLQSQFDQLMHSLVTTMNDILCPNTNAIGAGLPAGTYTDSNGKTVVINADSKVLDKANAPVGTDGKPGTELFTRNGVERYSKVTDPVSGEEFFVYNEEDTTDPKSMYTLGNMTVNKELSEAKEYGKLPILSASAGGVDNPDGNKHKVLDDLIDAWSKPAIGKENFDGLYSTMIGALASHGEFDRMMAETQQQVVTEASNKRLQTTGVSSDEELTNMIKFQHAYNASSRYINVVNDMLDNLFNSLG